MHDVSSAVHLWKELPGLLSKLATLQRGVQTNPLFSETEIRHPGRWIESCLPGMGIFRMSFSFISGSLFGMYVAQNYSLPNVKTLANAGFKMVKFVEQTYRKPAKKDDEG
ncbi:hypothetical protein H6P81_016883 [Aristolochia fimbriata]|uniref:Uncharacterized protein n=1 Tax=Aristolochia fimbriata TaxID=158543 RepID=A0AAV7DXM0_ARIFI|nr:hypothetical protein H6P81_016883 [Aristolochia fimbriata]